MRYFLDCFRINENYVMYFLLIYYTRLVFNVKNIKFIYLVPNQTWKHFSFYYTRSRNDIFFF